jgi:hypothetical protein
MTTIIETGAPHFKSLAKHHRHSNYTIYKFINEAIDNIIKKKTVTEIRIKTDVDDNNRLQKIMISDNYIKGFKNINEKGYYNPFNMGHISPLHDEDDETSEFGVGLKAGAISSGNQLTVITNVEGICYEIVCDFIRMSNEPNVNDSYNPVIRQIPFSDYKHFYYHPYDYGSTIIISNLFDNACEKMSQLQITLEIKKSISNTYSRFLSSKKIYVNDELVNEEKNFFSDPKCIPFSKIQKIFILGKPSFDNIFIRSTKTDRTNWYIYDKIKKKWDKLSDKNFLDNKLKEGYNHLYAPNDTSDYSCIEITSTFTFFSDYFNTDTGINIPEDAVYIYKDNRKYGNRALKNHNNGVNNYTIHKIDFISKKIGKEFDITYNKDILMEKNNDLTCSVKLAINDARKNYSADTSTAKYYDLYKKAKTNGFNMDAITPPTRLKTEPIVVFDFIEESESNPIETDTIQPTEEYEPINSYIIDPESNIFEIENPKVTIEDEQIVTDIIKSTEEDGLIGSIENPKVTIDDEIEHDQIVTDIIKSTEEDGLIGLIENPKVTIDDEIEHEQIVTDIIKSTEEDGLICSIENPKVTIDDEIEHDQIVTDIIKSTEDGLIGSVENPKVTIDDEIEHEQIVTDIIKSTEEDGLIGSIENPKVTIDDKIESTEEPKLNVLIENKDSNLTIDDEIKHSDCNYQSIAGLNDSMKKSKATIIRVAQMLMLKASSDDFNLSLEKSEYIYSLIENIL